MILEPDGTGAFESSAVSRTLGYGAEERVGSRVFDHDYPDAAAPSRVELAALSGSASTRALGEHRVRDGGGRWLRVESVGNDPETAGMS